MATEADLPVPVSEARGEQVGTFVDNIIKLSVSQLALEKQTQNDNHNELPTVEGENFLAPHSTVEVRCETNNVTPNVSKVIDEPVEETLAEERQQNGEESNSKDEDGDRGVEPEQCSTDSSVVTPEMDGATGVAQLSISTSGHHVTDDSSTENNVLNKEMLEETSLVREETESHSPCISEGEEVKVEVKATDNKSTDEKPTGEDMSSNFTNKVTSEHKELDNEKSSEDSFNSAAEEVTRVNCTSTNTIITPETSDSNELQSMSDLNSSLSKEETAVRNDETPLATSEDYRIPSENTLDDAATEKSLESSVVLVEDSQTECNEHLKEESERLPLTEVTTEHASDNVPAAMDTVGDEDEELKENGQSTRCTSVKEDVQIENPAESLHVVPENIEVSNQSRDVTLHGDTIEAEEETTDADGQKESLESFQPIDSSSHDEGSTKEVLQEATSDHKSGKTIDQELLENISSNEAQKNKDSTDTLLLSPKLAANEEISVEDMQKNVSESNSTDKDVVPEQISKDSSVVTSEIDDLKMDNPKMVIQLSKEMSSDHHGSNVSFPENVALTEEILQETDPLSKVIESNSPCISEGEELSDQVKKTDGKSVDEKPTEEDTTCDLTNEVSKEGESDQDRMVSEESVQKGLENEISVDDNLNTAAEEVYQDNSTSGETMTTPDTFNTDESQTKSVLNSSLSKEEETIVYESERYVTTSENYGVPSEETLSESHGNVVCQSKTLEDFATDHSDLNLASEKSSIVQVEDSQIECDEHLEEESERLPVTEVSTRGANDNVQLAMGTVKDKDEELKEAELSENEQSTRCTLVNEDVEIENPAESSDVALENMEVSKLSQDNQSKFLPEEQSTNATPHGNTIEAEEATIDAAEPQKDDHENIPIDEAYREVNNSSPNVSKDTENTDQTENDGTDTLLVSLNLADQRKEFAANEEKSAENITKNVEESDRTDKEVVAEQGSKDSSAVTSEIDDPEVVTQLPIDTSSNHIGSNASPIENAAPTEDELQRTDLTSKESESNLPCAPERDELIVQVKTTDSKSMDEKPAEEDMSCDLIYEVSKERESEQNKMTLENEKLENERSIEDNDSIPAATDDVKDENEAHKEAELSENEQTTRCDLVKEDAEIEKPAESLQVTLENIEASNLSQENKSKVLPEEQSTNKILHGNTTEVEAATNDAGDPREETLELVATETKHEKIEKNLASQVDCTVSLEEHLEKDTQNSSLTEAPEETNATESKNIEETIKPILENTESMSMKEDTDLEKTIDSYQVQPEDINQDDSSPDISNSIEEPISNTDSREISTDSTERESIDASHTNEGSVEIKDVAKDIRDCEKKDSIQVEEVGSQNPFRVENANDDESTKITEACLIKEEESLESLQAEAQDIDQNKMTLEQEGLENNRSVETNFNTAAGEVSHENSTPGATITSLETSENDKIPNESDSNPSLSKKKAMNVQEDERSVTTTEDCGFPSDNTLSESHGDVECQSKTLEDALPQKSEESSIVQVEDSQIKCEEHLTEVSMGGTNDNVPAASDNAKDEEEVHKETESSEHQQSARCTLVKEDGKIENPAESMHVDFNTEVLPEEQSTKTILHGSTIMAEEDHEEKEEALENVPTIVPNEKMEENSFIQVDYQQVENDEQFDKKNEQVSSAKDYTGNNKNDEGKIEDENPSGAELFENDKITESVLLAEEVQCERPVEPLNAALEDVRTSDFDQHTEATGILEEQIPAEKSQGIPSDETEGMTTVAADTNEITQELQNVTNEDSGKDLSIDVNASEMKHDTNLEEDLERPSVIEASNEECLSKVESLNNEKDSLQPEDHTTSTSNDMETTSSLDGQSLTENFPTSISEKAADVANEEELALESVATETTHGQVEENLVNQVDCADREQEEHLEKDTQNSSLTETIEETNVTESKNIDELKNRGKDSTKPGMEIGQNADYTSVKEETDEKPIDCDKEDSIQVEEVGSQNQLNEASTETANDDETTKITESCLIKAEESLKSLQVESQDTETHCLRQDSETCSPDEQSPLANSERIMDDNKEEIANSVTGVECESPKDKQNIANTILYEGMKENLQVQEDCSQLEENEVVGNESENIPSTEAPAVPSTEEEKVETPIEDQILTADPHETCNETQEKNVDAANKINDVVISVVDEDNEDSSLLEVDGLQKPSSEEFSAEKTTDPAGEETQEDQDTAKSAPREVDSPNEQNTEATLIKEDVSIELPQVTAEDTKEPCLVEVRETNSQEEHHRVLINDNEEDKTIDLTVFQKETPEDEVFKEMESFDGKAATKEEEGYLEGVQTTTAVNIVAFHQEKSSSLTAEGTPCAEDNNINKDVTGHIPEVSNYKQEESSFTEVPEEHTLTSNEPGSASMEFEVAEYKNDQVVGEANSCDVKTDSEKMEELSDGSIALPTHETLKKLEPTECTETEDQVPNGEEEAAVINQETEDGEKSIKETLPSYASEDISESRELNGEEEISSEEVPTSNVALKEELTSISPEEPKSETREEAETEEDQKHEPAPKVSQLVQDSSVEKVERDVQLYVTSANDSGITDEMEKIKEVPLPASEESITETTDCKESDAVEGATKNDDASPEIKETTLSSAEGQDDESESVEETSNCIETKNDDEAPEIKETILASAGGQDAKNASVEETSNCSGRLTEKKLDSNEVAITPRENKSGYSSNNEGLKSIDQVQSCDGISQIQFDKAVTEVTLQEETTSEKEIMKDDILSEKEQSPRIKKEDEEITEYQGSCEGEVITASHREDEVNQEQQINSKETDEYKMNENETETVATVSEEIDHKAPKDIQEKAVTYVAIERILHQEEEVTSIEEHTTKIDNEKAHEIETACLKTDTQDTNKESVQIANIPAKEAEEQNKKDEIFSSDEVQEKYEDTLMLSEGKSEDEAKETYKEACVEAEKLDFASETKGIAECAISDGAPDIPENNQNSTIQNKFPEEDIALIEQSSEDTIIAAEVQEAKAGLDLEDAVPEVTGLESREEKEFHDKSPEVSDTSKKVETPVVLTSTIIPEHTEGTPLEAEDQQTKLHGMPEELNMKGSEVKMAERELSKESFEKLTNENPAEEIPEEKIETSEGQETKPVQNAVSETLGQEIEEEQLGRGTNIPNQLGSSCYAENESVPESSICQSSVEDTAQHVKREGSQHIESSLFLPHVQRSDSKTSEKDLPVHVGGVGSIDLKEPEASSLSLTDKHVVLDADDTRNLNAENLDGEKNISTELSQGEHGIVKPSKVEQEEDKFGHEKRTEQEIEGKPELEETDKPSLSDLLQVSTTMRETSQMANHSPTEKGPTRHTEDRHAENTDEAEHENSKTDDEKDEDEGSHEQGKSDLSSEAPVMVDMGDADMKVTPKKSHNILSGVGSKMKHSIAKVKKAITGKSSHPKTPSPKKAINAETK